MKSELKLNVVPKIEHIQDMVLKSCEMFPTNLALRDLQDYPINSITYQELKEFILKFGKSLRSLGIEERSHIAIISENRVQWAISYLAKLF